MLPEKVAELKAGATQALTVAEFWESAIATHGEAKATAFYQSLGLNHLEKSKVEFDGLTLSREPNEVEKLCVKSIATAQDASKASVTAILLKLRTELIVDGIKAIKKLAAADYHTLILAVPDDIHSELRDQVGKVFMKGKKLVASELAGQKKNAQSSINPERYDYSTKQADPTDDEDAELDDLTDLTDSRVVNEVQGRITASAARFVMAGLIGKALWDAVSKEVGDGSTAWLDKIATGVSNNVLNFGRAREAEDRKDEWESVEYSAILDQNVCDSCASEDGETATNENDLAPTPNPDCDGGDFCRCFHVFVLDTVA